MLNEFRACLYTFRAHNENRIMLTKWQNVTAICFRHASMEKICVWVKNVKKRVLVAFDGQELPVFNAGKLLGFALRILLFLPA